ncbi:Sporulation kinase E [Rubripirellula amarantea]|uniref:histidine kinase n=1 Tax=Rubripirellula amarantea TaxID=2527999 RepID=A0A5C5WTQ0_9BACT|nr:ATP-binding protein [Rubripirellula amarantea]TWT53890.1 Sporulation kinase E [Rubripirellula amarantea]
MFRFQPETGKNYRLAISALLALSVAAIAVTVWVEVDFLREQKIVQELIKRLPSDAAESAEELAGELRWQFRITILVVLNLVVAGLAILLLSSAYRASQQSLRDVKALSGDILSSIDQAVLTTDPHGKVTSINRRGIELLGASRQCVGVPLESLSDKLQLNGFRMKGRSKPSSDHFQEFTLTDNGTERTLQGSCQTLTDFEGKDIGNVLQLRDVTQQVLVKERMRRMERYMGLGSLAVGLHHEIKNPLAALSLHVQLLEEHLNENHVSEDVDQMLSVITTEVQRVGTVLEGFRDFASLGELNPEWANLGDLIVHQVQLLTPKAKQSNVVLIDKTSLDSIAKVRVDRPRIEQVFFNLLNNAIQAMPNGGRVVVDTIINAESFTVTITDEGPGIPDDLKDCIFDPYFTTKSEGTGLGLALSDKIMRQHNGGIEFHTSPAGTTFEITLPIASPFNSKI